MTRTKPAKEDNGHALSLTILVNMHNMEEMKCENLPQTSIMLTIVLVIPFLIIFFPVRL